MQINGNPSTSIEHVAFDSRKVQPGSLFVALQGGYTDGHNYLQQALGSGAVAAIVEPDTSDELIAGYQAVGRVQNTRGALAQIAAAFYDDPSRDLTLIGVTGTDGKTTTSTILHDILTHAGRHGSLVGTAGVRLPRGKSHKLLRQTTPESLEVQELLYQTLHLGDSFSVLETTSHALETHRVDECAFDIGVVTNVTREHLDFHGTVARYRAAKAKLLRQVDQQSRIDSLGICVLNRDDEGTREIAHAAGSAEVVWFSAGGDQDANLFATSIEPESNGIRFKICGDWGSSDVWLPLAGRWNVSNALAATLAALALEVELDVIVDALETVRPVPGRMQLVDAGQPFSVVVDYAHTPQALTVTLKELRTLTSGKLIVLFGSAGERDIEKRAEQGALSAQLADFSVFTSEDPRFEDPEAIIDAIKHGALQAGGREHVDFECIEDRRTAIQFVIDRAEAGDTVLLAGKGHETSMIYGAEQRPWNEATVALEALAQRGFHQDT